MRLQDSSFMAALQVQNRNPVQFSNNGSIQENSISFQEVLERKRFEQQDVKFSKHAVNRLSERGIEISDLQMKRLEHGARMAQDKGIKESLVVVDKLAFIVNVPNKTVVTAMDQDETDSSVFTNIDGAVFA